MPCPERLEVSLQHSQRHRAFREIKLLTLMGLMHELKQFIDNCLEEFPVRF